MQARTSASTCQGGNRVPCGTDHLQQTILDRGVAVYSHYFAGCSNSSSQYAADRLFLLENAFENSKDLKSFSPRLSGTQRVATPIGCPAVPGGATSQLTHPR